jgi:UDP-glucose 4-epimerase
MTKILVTGGNGFIGRYVCDELAARGFEPLVLDRSVKPAPLREFETVLGDVRDDVHVTEAMAHADGWIHLAGVLGTQETIDDPRPAVLTNVIGGLNVLQAAKRYGLPGVNIGVGNFWMQNPYSISKHTVERFALMMANEAKLPVCTVRALNAYGPGQSVSAPFGSSKVRKIMPSFICRALRRMPIQVYGDGKQIMDMVYVADGRCSEWAAERHGCAGRSLRGGHRTGDDGAGDREHGAVADVR